MRLSRAAPLAITTARATTTRSTPSSQNPHVIRLLMTAFVLGLPEHKVRVVSPDVGGGFGSKIFHYAEEVLVTWCSRQIGRPVKWTASRSEAIPHRRPRPPTTTPRSISASTPTGISSACGSKTVANLGAYLSTFAPCVPTYLYGTLLQGLYTTPSGPRRRHWASSPNTTPR